MDTDLLFSPVSCSICCCKLLLFS